MRSVSLTVAPTPFPGLLPNPAQPPTEAGAAPLGTPRVQAYAGGWAGLGRSPGNGVGATVRLTDLMPSNLLQAVAAAAVRRGARRPVRRR